MLADLGGIPVAWARSGERTWFAAVQGSVAKIATPTARILQVAADGSTTTAAAIGPLGNLASSMTLDRDGSIWLGARGGVVKLVPIWNEPPRYWPTYFVPGDSSLLPALTSGRPCAPPPIAAPEVSKAVKAQRAAVQAARDQWQAEIRRRETLGCAPVATAASGP